MHPLIKILSFILFSAFVSVGSVDSIIAGIVLLLIVWFVTKSLPDRKSFLMIRRMKIFFISIFFIYVWFTPGELMFPLLDTWSPTYEGVTLASLRVIALCILVMGVSTLLRITPRDELVCGLYYFTYPLSWFGVPRERLIARIILTLEFAANPPVRVNKNKNKTEKLTVSHYLDSMIERFSVNMEKAIDVDASHQELIVELLPPPTKLEWFYFLSLILFFIAALLFLPF